jgi:hypothetical protein
MFIVTVPSARRLKFEVSIGDRFWKAKMIGRSLSLEGSFTFWNGLPCHTAVSFNNGLSATTMLFLTRTILKYRKLCWVARNKVKVSSKLKINVDSF